MPGRPPSGVDISPASPSDRPLLEGILRRTGLFRHSEVAVALEVIDTYLNEADQRDYLIYTAGEDGKPSGYVCFGPNSMTEGVYELYWIAVDPERQGTGIGSALMSFAERLAVRGGGRKMAVETSSREDYRATRSFYLRLGYHEEARVRDFYAAGDDKIIFIKDL